MGKIDKVSPELQSKVGRGEVTATGRAGYYNYDQTYRGSKAGRKPFKIYTVASRNIPASQRPNESTGDTGIWFWVNPSECSWRTPLRTSIDQVQGGAMHYEWGQIGSPYEQSQYYKFDQTTIAFTFQSGNIIPNSDVDIATAKDHGLGQHNAFNRPSDDAPFLNKRVPAGLGNFYDFLELLNEPNILANGSPNFVVIEYVSMIFPSVTLYGFFSQEGVSWSDSADNPLGVASWAANFIVCYSYPALWNKKVFNSLYLENMFGDS